MAGVSFGPSLGFGVSGHLDYTPDFKVGDPAPSGYTDWHAWADVQAKGGLKQGLCPICCKWFFPHEKCGHDIRRKTQRQVEAEDRRIAKQVRKEFPTQEDQYRKDMKAMRKKKQLPPNPDGAEAS